MIPLKEFILIEMYNHICIEWDRLDESKGIPTGLREDAKYIASEILEHKEKYNFRNFEIKINVSKLELEFDKLTCKVYTEKKSSEARILTSDTFSKSAILKLYINKEDFSFKKLIPLIGHELLHWYTYIINGEEKSKSVFNKRISQIDQNKFFNNSESLSEIITKGILYHFGTDELNAFIAEITLEIEQEKPSSIEEAYQLLLKNELYKGYLDLYTSLVELSEQDNKEIFKIYRKLNPADSTLSDSKIFQKLKKRFKYVKKRLIKIIPRILLDNKSTVIK